MIRYLQTFFAFLCGILLFLTIALFVLAPLWPKPSLDQSADEGVISKTAISGYPKQMDSVYFNAASVLIPTGALAFWFLIRRWRVRYVFLVSMGWFIILVFAILKQ